MAATKRRRTGPVKGSAGTEFKRGDAVTVGERAGRITGFSRDGRSIYVRFDDGETPAAGRFSRHDVLLGA